MDLQQAAPLIEALGNVLPCAHCREALSELIKLSPVQAESRWQLAIWMWRLHNSINYKLDKPIVNATSALDERNRPTRAETVQAVRDLTQVIALNYPEQPDQGDKIVYKNFFTVLGQIFDIELAQLQDNQALGSRDQLFAWLLSPGVLRKDGLANQRSLLEKIRAVQKNKVTAVAVAAPVAPPSPSATWQSEKPGAPPLVFKVV
jgi:hypothetical protein